MNFETAGRKLSLRICPCGWLLKGYGDAHNELRREINLSRNGIRTVENRGHGFEAYTVPLRVFRDPFKFIEGQVTERFERIESWLPEAFRITQCPHCPRILVACSLRSTIRLFFV